jgi:large subunit ribosomal protein L21
MFAVIRTGGKQYRVAKDDIISVEKLDGGEGASVTLDQVLMIGNGKNATIGAPLVAGASVTATVLEQARADKIIVFKKKRRKDYRRKAGHRQNLTVLRINDIRASGGKAVPQKVEVKKTEPAKEAKKAPEKKAAEKKAPAKKTEAKKTEAKKTEAKKPVAKKTKAKAKPAAKKAPAKKSAAKKTPKKEK